MTTYKAFGYDATNIVPIVPSASDVLQVPGDLLVNGTIQYNGNVIAVDNQINLGDRYILLNADHVGTGGSDVEDAGILFNVDPDNAKKQTGNVNFSSSTQITLSSRTVASSFPNHALVIISGAEDPENNGLYQVHEATESGGNTIITFADASTNTPESDVSGLVQTAAFTTNSDDDEVSFSPTKIMVLKSASATNELSFGYGTVGGAMTFSTLQSGGVAADDISTGDAAVTIATSSGAITLDSPTDVNIDADSGDINLKDGGTQFGTLSNSSSDFVISSNVQDKDIKFNGNDGGSSITALTLDMSEAGAATFSGSITCATSLTIGSAEMSEADLEQLDGITAGTVAASKAVVVDSNKDASGFRNISATQVSTGTTVVTDDSIVMTPSTDDTATIAAATNGVLNITTVDNAAAAADINLTADGKISLDAADEINLDATGDINLKDGGTQYGTISQSSSDFVVSVNTQDKDFIIQGNDGGSGINALTLDMSDGGAATFTGSITCATSLTIGSAAMSEADLEQLDGITAGTAAASKALVLDSNKDIGTIRNLTIDGVFTDGNYTFDTAGNVSGLGTVGCGAITSSGNLAVTGTITGDTSLTLDSTTITTAEIGVLDSVTAGTAAASKALVLDSNKDIGTIRNLTIDGVFTDGNYTFDTSGNVSGLGTVGCGAITSTGNSSMVQLTTSGRVIVDDATEATSTTDGSLQTDGGLSVAKSAVIGDDLDLLSDAAIVNFGADKDITLTHVADTGLTLGGSNANGTNLKIDNSAGDGDSRIEFALSGTTAWSIGVEDGDSDKFVLNLGSGALGAGVVLEADSNADVTMNGKLAVGDDVSLSGNVSLTANKGIGYPMSSAAAHAVGSVLFFNSSGKAAVADADAVADGRVMGIALEAASGANEDKLVCTLVGSVVDVVMDATYDSSALPQGAPVYLSTTAGKATPTAPTGAGDQVVRLGFAFEAGNDSDTARQIIFQPQYIGTVN